MDELAEVARYINADEVVVPDVLRDMEQTIDLATAFKVMTLDMPVSVAQYMGVLQGNTYDEVMRCAEAMHHMGYITTFGIPRVLNYSIGFGARATVWERVLDAYGDEYDHHFLGYSEDMMEIKELAQLDIQGLQPRSIDTSLPFSLAMEGLNFQDKEYVDRPPNYFDRHFSPLQRSRARKNCDWFIKEASGGKM